MKEILRYVIYSNSYWELQDRSFRTKEEAQKKIDENEWDSGEEIFEIIVEI